MRADILLFDGIGMLVYLLAAALVPVLLLIGYGVRKTNGSWETPALGIGLAAGAAMGIVALVIELLLTRALHIKATPTIGSAAYEAFAIAAVPEEVVKYVALLVITTVYLDGRRLQDVLLVAVGIGMGFAGLENIAYVAGSRVWELTAIIRAVSAVPTHGVLALTMGSLVIATIFNDGSRCARPDARACGADPAAWRLRHPANDHRSHRHGSGRFRPPSW